MGSHGGKVVRVRASFFQLGIAVVDEFLQSMTRNWRKATFQVIHFYI